jgi:hypothetical protein
VFLKAYATPIAIVIGAAILAFAMRPEWGVRLAMKAGVVAEPVRRELSYPPTHRPCFVWDKADITTIVDAVLVPVDEPCPGPP